MSRYVGWNEAASRRVWDEAPQGNLQLPSHDTMTPTETLKSLTPINQGPARTSVARDAVKARSRGLDSDMLFDIPDIPLTGSPAPKKRRKVSTKPARLKRRPASALAHPWPKANEKESSQLSTPPDSRKRPSKRLSTQTELFSSSTITKPILFSMKMITTEDALKSQSASLGQTTMDKLASFRFQPTAQCLSGVQANGVADSMERVFAETGKAHEPHHDTSSHDRDSSNYAVHDHGPTSHIEGGPYAVLDDGDLMGYNEDELCQEIINRNHACHNPEDPYEDFDEAAILFQDSNMIMLNEEEINATLREVISVAQPESEDDFPLDDDLEAEMAQLSMPDKKYGYCSPRSVSRSTQNGNLQSTETDNVHSQSSSSTLYTLISDHRIALNATRDRDSSVDSITNQGTVPRSFAETMDWSSTNDEELDRVSIRKQDLPSVIRPSANLAKTILFAESDEYSPLEPFARPPFPSKVRDRSPINGVSSSIILRTCFRTGEALREGALYAGLEQDAIIELFARVRDYSFDIVSPSKLYFEFADLFHDRPPFIRGTLENNKISGLQEAESRMLRGANGSRPMTRCLGRLKRVIAGPPGWMLYIINIRPTDWEEVRWTRQIAGAGMAKQ